jgi:hypothetical protein
MPNAKDIRIAQGQVTAYELLSNDAHLVSEWTRTSDMNASVYWSASQPDKPLERPKAPQAMGLGAGRFYGGYSGVFSFFMTTPLMRQYLFETLMQSRPVAAVTVYMQAALGGFENAEFQVVYGEIERIEYERFNDDYFMNVNYEFRLGTVVEVSNLLLETGDYLLLESGDKLSLESQ